MAYPTASIGTRIFWSAESAGKSITAPTTTTSVSTQLLVIKSSPKAVTWSAPGWTTIVSAAHAVADGRLTILRRTGVYSGAVTLTPSASVTAAADAVSSTGSVDSFAPGPTNINTTPTTASAPSVTAARAETLWLQVIASAEAARRLVLPSGVTGLSSLTDHSSHTTLGSGTKQVGLGATGASGAWTFQEINSPFNPQGERPLSASIALSIPAGVTLAGSVWAPLLRGGR
jgi:hypothetical protein